MINPHSWFHVDVKDSDGKVTTWMIEGGSPNQLIRMGVTKNTVPVGTELMIDAYMAKDGTNKAVGRDFTFNDGRRLFRRLTVGADDDMTLVVRAIRQGDFGEALYRGLLRAQERQMMKAVRILARNRQLHRRTAKRALPILLDKRLGGSNVSE